jgi:hypothetical protein
MTTPALTKFETFPGTFETKMISTNGAICAVLDAKR